MSRMALELSPASQRERLIDFLRRDWRADHVFVEHPEMLDWQHLAAGRDVHNFIVASKAADMQGVLGFIPQSHFDPALEDRRHLFLAIWRIAEDRASPGLGLMLLNRLRQIEKPAFIGAIGLSETVRPIYQALGYEQGVLDHSVIFHPSKERFRLARFSGSRIAPPAPPETGTRLYCERIDAAVLTALSEPVTQLLRGRVPAKSPEFLLNRYLLHPWYAYELYALMENGILRGLVVLRCVEAEGGKALRVVDLIGLENRLPGLADALRELVVDRGAEYADMYSHGLDREALDRAGFLDRRSMPDLIVPNYFEPFERRNVDIHFAYKQFGGSAGSVKLFRGDSDQDRPSELPAKPSEGKATRQRAAV